jgi:hypothetical protein
VEPEVRVQRAILRTIQKHAVENDGAGIERSLLGLHTRPYDQDNWGVALDDLVQRGIITEGSIIRAKQSQKRAVIVYTMSDPTNDYPDFDSMTPEALGAYLNKTWPLHELLPQASSL